MPYTTTSTIITSWAPDVLNYLWDSITGFFYASGANGFEFIIVFIILIAVVCIVVASIKSVIPIKKF